MFSWGAREERAYTYWCYLGKKLPKLHIQCLQPLSSTTQKSSSPSDRRSRYNLCVECRPIPLHNQRWVGHGNYGGVLPQKQTEQIKSDLFRGQLQFSRQVSSGKYLHLSGGLRSSRGLCTPPNIELYHWVNNGSQTRHGLFQRSVHHKPREHPTLWILSPLMKQNIRHGAILHTSNFS